MKIVKVNNLPQTYEADTIYLVKSSTAGLMDIYVTDNTGTQIRSLAIDTAAVNSLLQVSEVGVTVASLVDGKIPTDQLPPAILGALSYQGTWNASTNNPAIPTASPSNKGWYYVVSTAGTSSIGGVTDWEIGDWVVSSGTGWGMIDNSDKVSSVAGKTGVVTLTKSDVGLANVNNTSDANKPVSTATQTALNLKANLESPFFTGTPEAPTAAFGSNTTQLANTAYVIGERVIVATLTNKTLISPAINDPTTTGAIYDNGSVRGNITAVGALDINCSLGNYFTKTISANSTFTVSNVPSSRAYAFTLELTHTSGTVTWFANVQWPGGTAPTLTTGKTHLFTFVTDNGGARWRGVANTNYTN